MRREIIDASQLGELKDKVVAIKRVTKVVKGGRNFRFTALVVVGDGAGHVGAGLGKASEIPEAIRKGKEDAAKHLVSVARDENESITHDQIGKVSSQAVRLVSFAIRQVLRTSVRSPLAPTTSRTLYWQRSMVCLS